MDDIVSSPSSPNIKKRHALEDTPDKKPLNVKGNQFMMPTPPDTDQSSNVSPDVSIDNENDEPDRAVSPAPSSSALSSTVEIALSNVASSSAINTGPPPAKRRKLTTSEKLEKQQEKEVKEREKAELKARKDEEKRVKDEEKAKKDEEKREEKRIKDKEKRRKAEEKEVKKREKELEEERKVQEKLNKERKQMRLGAFFQQKPVAAAQQSDVNESQARARRRSLSLEMYDSVSGQIERAISPARGKGTPPMSAKNPVVAKPEVPDYYRVFLPFELRTHTVMANLSREYSETAQDTFDQELRAPSLQEQYDLGLISRYQRHAELGHYFASELKVARGIQFPKMRDLVDSIHGTSGKPIDLTSHDWSNPVDLLRQVPVKHIHFEEDVRPAYCGTYTKIRSPATIRKLQHDPFTRVREDTNYDYDSEAEWEPPEEGDEEVLSDEEDEADSQADANDMDFLDDEEDTVKNKRKMITGELVPETTGLCWANGAGRISVVGSIDVHDQPQEMHFMTMGFLLPGFSGQPIDPFSTAYWQNFAEAPSFGAQTRLRGVEKDAGSMAPPRQPLQPRINGSPKHDLVGAAEGHKGPITSTSAATQTVKRGPKATPKTLSKEDFEEFKEAVVDSPLGKLELQKGLKARFPKMTNEIIKETLSSCFAQVGKGKADKHWVFVGHA